MHNERLSEERSQEAARLFASGRGRAAAMARSSSARAVAANTEVSSLEVKEVGW